MLRIARKTLHRLLTPSPTFWQKDALSMTLHDCLRMTGKLPQASAQHPAFRDDPGNRSQSHSVNKGIGLRKKFKQ
ncbi:hypothetical protein SAMN06265222_11423 [Neorhodopirellula lusitana]|uniref:Uncharacterized protein n=1 Tax=Neorhodopirellula lusitana TaxID=445327 RepID=A0ABY1QK35_9BACT|nr:hypothetical protein [Neorhodopirellula lusitana]SMP71305.1 hypothetical protein SAMN06265222_11423 [Neorhodopirellula lusitana]